MTDFVEVKTQDLSGAALDWTVAQVDGVKTIMMAPRKDQPKKPFALFGSLALAIGGDDQSSYAPSTCWHCGGPLIAAHRVSVIYSDEDCEPCAWTDSTAPWHGSTPLIAACRAIVASHFGDTVSVPKELCHE
ncbi:phage protein NinX family protein [Pseudomonas protegens]|uniref:phage protein NinX family protein n=1 Tax=Pseudomonas protegens TaxID=380021 RepID=UPI0037F43729